MSDRIHLFATTVQTSTWRISLDEVAETRGCTGFSFAQRLDANDKRREGSGKRNCPIAGRPSPSRNRHGQFCPGSPSKTACSDKLSRRDRPGLASLDHRDQPLLAPAM